MTEQDRDGKTNDPDETESTESTTPANGNQAEAEGSEEAEDLWAAAMAEQEAQEAQEPPAQGSDSNQDDDEEEEDLWAAAMAEQTQAEAASEPPAETPSNAQQSKTSASTDEDTRARPDPTPAQGKQVEAEAAGERVFRPLEQSGQNSGSRDLDMILDIPVRLSVELGRTKVTIKQLLEMAQGSVVELDGLAGEPMDILINGYLIAQGEVVVVEDKYGIRITEIVTPSERVQKLNR